MIYLIEYWNKDSRQYHFLWKGQSFERAEIMFNKPYYRRLTRRLISIDTKIVLQEKAKK